MSLRKTTTIFVLIILLGLAGCRSATELPPTLTPVQATPTFTPAPPTETPTPTATPVPLALTVNGEGVSLAEYQAELVQLQQALAALGQELPAEEQRQKVLDNLTDTALLAQGAREGGYTVDDAALQSEINRLGEKLGSPDALRDWYTLLGYSEDAFRETLRRQLAAAWQRDQLAAAVPAAAEQVQARQILTTDQAVAGRALEQVKLPGVNFAAQAYRYDPVTGGDLGWFPRGYLTQQAVEDAAFALQPGEISAVIPSEIGFHIIQVISRQEARPLSPDALRVLQHKAVQSWLAARRAAVQVEVLAP